MKQLLFALAGAALPLLAASQQNKLAAIDSYLQAQASVNHFNGAVLVAQKGRILYQKAFGLAVREWQIPNTVNTRFPIASVTKQFTAAAIMQLADKGKLDPNDRLSKYFPGYPKGDSITLHMLLNHTSGIREQSANPELFDLNPNLPIDSIRDTMINLFKHQPFDFEPGTFWRYSNSGYILLGYIIEKVSGLPYRDYLQQHLLTPAGLHNTGMLKHDSLVPFMAQGYLLHEHTWKKPMIIPINTTFSAGGIFSTIGDLHQWSEALYGGKLLSPAAFTRMHTPNRGDHGAGYGVFIENLYGHRTIQHDGRIPGFTSKLVQFPDDDLRIIVLSNREMEPHFIVKGIAGILFNLEVVNPYPHKRLSGTLNGLAAYAGTYEGPHLPFPLQIVEKEGRLFMRMHRDIELQPESATTFFIAEPDVDVQVQFVPDDTGAPTHVYFIEGGVKLKATPQKK